MSDATSPAPGPPATSPPGCRPIAADEEERALRRLRFRVARATLRSLLSGARLRVALVAILSVVFWALLYGLFHEAFAFIDSLHAEVVPLVFNTFFSALLAMLLFSAAILLYGSLYASPRSRFLLTLPTRASAVWAHAFREALWFSGWGFILLGSPLLVAHGVVRQAPWTYYLLLLPLLVSFAAIPATVGAILCMLLVAWLPRVRLHALGFGIAAALGVIAWLGWSAASAPGGPVLSEAWFQQAFARLRVTEQRLSPSFWLSSALVDAAAPLGAGHGRLADAVRYLAVLASNALALGLVARALADRFLRLGVSRLLGDAPARRRRLRSWWIDDWITETGTRAGRPLRLLVVKDLRVFRRDVSQWSQAAIFLGLLALYSWNVRVLDYHHAYAAMIGFLNLAVVALIFSTFTTRFVFPSISLEGRCFWILGLLPVGRDRIVWSKFLFSFAGGVVPCCALVALSDARLGVAPWIIAIHVACSAALCAGLSGIAVGFGAMWPDLREPSPARLAAGFGGTLCLVTSALVIIAAVLVTAVPVHFRLAADDRAGPLRDFGAVDAAVAAGVLAALALSSDLSTIHPKIRASVSVSHSTPIFNKSVGTSSFGSSSKTL